MPAEDAAGRREAIASSSVRGGVVVRDTARVAVDVGAAAFVVVVVRGGG